MLRVCLSLESIGLFGKPFIREKERERERERDSERERRQRKIETVTT